MIFKDSISYFQLSLNQVGKIAKIKQSEGVFVNSALKIQCYVVKNTEYFFGDFAHWEVALFRKMIADDWLNLKAKFSIPFLH